MKKLCLLIPFVLLSNINASELDLGVGVATFSYPDYLGSDKDNTLIFPYPYVEYKSDTLEINNKGLKQDLFTIGDFTLQASLSGSLPAKSSGIRDGMPKLDPSGEIGPAIFYSVYTQNNTIIDLEFPLRAVLSTDFESIEYRGYIYEAKFRASYETENGYIFKMSTGAVWGDSRYHNYLYGVTSDMVKENRPFYKADAGYTGYKTSFGISKTFDNMIAGGFIRHYSLKESVIGDSPLKVKNSALYGSIYLSYIFDKELSNPIKKWLEE